MNEGDSLKLVPVPLGLEGWHRVQTPVQEDAELEVVEPRGAAACDEREPVVLVVDRAVDRWTMRDRACGGRLPLKEVRSCSLWILHDEDWLTDAGACVAVEIHDDCAGIADAKP